MRISLTASFLFFLSFLGASTFEVTVSRPDYLEFTFNLPAYKLAEKTESTKQIICQGASSVGQEGYPALPVFATAIGLPQGGSYSFQILQSEQTTLNNISIEPSQGSLLEKTFSAKDKKIYASHAPYPANAVMQGSDAAIRDRYFRSLIINPFQVIPAENKLIVTKKMKIAVYIRGNLTESRSYTENFMDKTGNSFFLNNQYAKKWRLPRQQSSETSILPRNVSQIDNIKIVVGETGIYKVTYGELVNSLQTALQESEYTLGFSWENLNPQYFELYDKNGTVPIYFSGEADGKFDAWDYFEFFGERHAGDEDYYDDYTAENTYILKLTDHKGARMAVENGGLLISNSALYTVPRNYEQTVHFEQENTFSRLSALKQYNEGRDHLEDIWFWRAINAPELVVFPIDLEYPSSLNTKNYTVKVQIVGNTFPQSSDPIDVPDHHVNVRFNSHLINDIYWVGQKIVAFTNSRPLPNSMLINGENNLYVSLPGDTYHTSEQVFLDYMEINYWREYRTDSDYLEFTKPADKAFGLFQFELKNFSSGDVSVYKIGSSKMENLQITAFDNQGNAPYTVTFQDSVLSENVKYCAVTEANKKQPLGIYPDYPSHLKNATNNFDALLVLPDVFKNDEDVVADCERIFSVWREKGYNPTLIYLQDIFDEFSNGIRSSQGIKDFISYAYNNWSGNRLQAVLLVGDGHSDERDYSVNRVNNLIPAKMIWTDNYGATPSDVWYGCVSGDDPIMDVAIGRYPAREPDDVKVLADKIEHYYNEPDFASNWHSNYVMCSGGKVTDNDLFALQTENTIDEFIPQDANITRVYTMVISLPQAYKGNTSDIKDALGDGALYLQFMGHGGGRIWDDYNLFNNDDVMSLNNDQYPLAVSLSCYGSAFDSPGSSSIGETFVLKEGGGAIAHIGFTGLGYRLEDLYYSWDLTEAIFDKQFPTLGECISYTIARFYARFLPGYAPRDALTYGTGFLGDPLTSLILPTKGLKINLSNYTPALGDTLTISGTLPNGYNTVKVVVKDEYDIPVNIPVNLPVTNGTFSYQYRVPVSSSVQSFERDIKVYASSPTGEITGISKFCVGKPVFTDFTTVPALPAGEDSIYVKVKIYDRYGVQTAWFLQGTSEENATVYPLVYDPEEECYKTTTPIPPRGEAIRVPYILKYLNGNGENKTSASLTFDIGHADLVLSDPELVDTNGSLSLRVKVQNSGNMPSLPCTLELTKVINPNTSEVSYVPLVNKTLAEIQPLQTSIEYLPLPTMNETVNIRVGANLLHEFSEANYGNNSVYAQYQINTVKAGRLPITQVSSDGSFIVEYPSNLLAEEATFNLTSLTDLQVKNQPDTRAVSLLNALPGTGFKISCLRSDLLTDSLGTFPSNGTIKIRIRYNSADTLNQSYAKKRRLNIYRWEGNFSKWVNEGGMPVDSSQAIVVSVSRTGTYGLFYNADTKEPSIEANVEDQEFTLGGYIAGNGIISFTLSDANGIDIFDYKPRLFLQGTEIAENEFSLAKQSGQLIHVPLKYQIDLAAGHYTIIARCSDVNGNSIEKAINFEVNDVFELRNVANYPNPVVSQTISPANSGRTRFTYVLTDSADHAKLEIFTVSGRLVKAFKDIPTSVGYHEYPRSTLGWDLTDEKGNFLANGVYFYKLTAKKGHKKIEKVQKMAVLK